jgi:hypothetical protein
MVVFFSLILNHLKYCKALFRILKINEKGVFAEGLKYLQLQESISFIVLSTH